MPYVYKEELDEDEVEAQVVESDIADAISKERDDFKVQLDKAVSERDNLARELDDAKAKFANAFLSSPQKMKQDQKNDVKEDSSIQTFDALFSGRNKYNAN